MFTGLIEDTGSVVSLAPRQGGKVVRIRTALPLGEVALGDSIACNGVCLTVEATQGDTFTATAGRETLSLTTWADVQVGARVHLERALALGDRLGGHLVQGHVDCVATVTSCDLRGESWVIWIDAPPEHARYIAAKGSITVDGVSLTVNEVDGTRFRVNIVPHTAQVTRMASYGTGTRVNLETDVLAKYVERLLSRTEEGMGLSLDTLIRNGFA